MPISKAITIPQVIGVIAGIQPESILDVGVGFGKWGYLFREYTDIRGSHEDPTRYQKPNWKVRIDGIEGFSAYLHDGHRFIYDRIYEGDARDILPSMEQYDVIFFGDIIEHFTLAEGQDILKTALLKARLCVMLTTPKYDTPQGDICDNPLEIHRCLWGKKEFRSIGPCITTMAGLQKYVVVYPVGGPEVWKKIKRALWYESPRGPVESLFVRIFEKIKRALHGQA